MPVFFSDITRTFYLTAGKSSYVIRISPQGQLVHLHWGGKVNLESFSSSIINREWAAFSPNPIPEAPGVSFDTMPLEYPGFGRGDFREPAYHVQLSNGTTVTDLRYDSHVIKQGKPGIEGMPATYVEDDAEAETLEITLKDDVTGLYVILSYTAYADLNVVTRQARLINRGNDPIRVVRAMSTSVDMPGSDYDILHLSGAWARERHISRSPLRPGSQGISSRRGASSHQQNPFIALMSRDAVEDHGEVFGFSFVYSGNFLASAEVDQYFNTRVVMGINPFDFSWLLEPGEDFQTPEVVMVYSKDGLGGMSRTYHKLYRSRLCRGSYRDRERPILINNWEATYFNFDEEKIAAIAETAASLGMELMVLDDGWFGKRDDDRSSLGDWTVDSRKLPRGLDGLAKRVNGLGMSFGLWFEPEMISPDSDLYRAHPDWCLHVPEFTSSLGRNQLTLDLSRPEVCDYIIETISAILSSAPISYVKWDMNRHMSEVGSATAPVERQRETAHRYMLGLYKVLETITARFPEVLFESCSGGGGRFDPGMLYFMPQVWTSDDTDAIERLKIQYGTSIVYPISSMGAHVSAVPNHQNNRITPLETRGNVAMAGAFGYELDLTKMSEGEKDVVRHQVATFKELRHLMIDGDFYRLKDPFNGQEAAWMVVSPDKKEAFIVHTSIMPMPNGPIQRLRLAGLYPELTYAQVGTDRVWGGDELMEAGITFQSPWGDFTSRTWWLKAR